MVEITPEELAKSAKKYRKDLLMMPVIALGRSLQHMTIRLGVRGEEVVGELDGDIEMGPYSETRVDENGATIKGRSLYTWRGSVIKKFSPNSVAESIYGDSVLKGEGLKTTEITLLVVGYYAKKVSKALNKALWTAVRNANGTKSADLFNGFDTITDAEITAGNISVAKGNLYEFTEVITASNACDQLKAFYRAADDNLQEETTKMFMAKSHKQNYEDCYKNESGSVAYNTEFKKTFLEGTEQSCEMVALANKKGSKYIHLTTKGNMLIGVDQMGDEESISVEKHHPLLLDFVMVMYFGVQFESISPERIIIGKLKTA